VARWNPLGHRDALTASVTVIDAADAKRKRLVTKRTQDEKWQADGYAFYRMVGELRFTARYMGHGVGSARYFVGHRTSPDDPLTAIPDSAQGVQATLRDSLFRLRGRDGTFASLAKRYGIQQFIGGESYLVGREQDSGNEQWDMLSPKEYRRITEDDGTVTQEILTRLGDWAPLKATDFSARLHTPDPEDHSLADSPTRSVLDVLEALVVAAGMLTATDRARLALNGILLIPTEAEMPKKVDGDSEQQRLALFDTLADQAMAVMADPSHPSSTIPALVEVRGDTINSWRHLTLDRQIDTTIFQRIEGLLKRLALGIDLPPEKLVGTEAVNHWGMWQVAQEAVTAHIGPLAQQLCEDLTIAYLKPVMKKLGLTADEQQHYGLAADVTDLVVNPNRSKDTREVFDRGGANFHALRRDHALSDEDAPDAAELALMMELGVLKGGGRQGGPTPDREPVTPVDVEEGTPEGSPADGESPPDQVDDTTQTTSARVGWVGGWVVGLVDMAIERALERAGNKLRSKAKRSTSFTDAINGTRADLVASRLGPGALKTLDLTEDQLLEGAWDQLAERLGKNLPPQSVAQIIDGADTIARARLWDPRIDTAGAMLALLRKV
jgi:hypothetical protein